MAALVPDRLVGALAYRQAVKDRDRHDHAGADCCALSESSSSLRHALADAHKPHPDWAKIEAAKAGDPVVHGGKVLAVIPGMGKVIDWRPSSWTPTSGGKIRPLLLVDHIPVVANMPGIADFIRLRDVLVAQGLMVQCSTDSAGNVALFTPLNYLCYQARGANSFSAGCEHMHYSLTEPWTSRQINAAAYVHWRAWKYQRISNHRAWITPGNGVVHPRSRGYTTHMEISAKAGYHDRSDPGSLFEAEYDRIEAGVRYFDKRRTFQGF